MKLAITQMVLGTIIVADYCFILLASPTILFVNPVLGLSVLGCGIAQYLEARKRGLNMKRHPEGARLKSKGGNEAK